MTLRQRQDSLGSRPMENGLSHPPPLPLICCQKRNALFLRSWKQTAALELQLGTLLTHRSSTRGLTYWPCHRSWICPLFCIVFLTAFLTLIVVVGWMVPLSLPTIHPYTVNVALSRHGLCRHHEVKDLEMKSFWIICVGSKSKDKCPKRRK